MPSEVSPALTLPVFAYQSSVLPQSEELPQAGTAGQQLSWRAKPTFIVVKLQHILAPGHGEGLAAALACTQRLANRHLLQRAVHLAVYGMPCTEAVQASSGKQVS